MTDRLKLLDANRKAILTLPANALKLWFVYYMNEDEERESFLSQDEIKTQSGMSVPTIITWTKYLVRHGWLIDTGKTAYDKWLARGIMPTANSKQVVCYRVDDPKPKESLDVPPLKTFEGYTTKSFLDKVSCSGSSSCSGSPSRSRRESKGSSSSESGEVESRPSTPTAKPKTESPEPKPTPIAGKRKRVMPEGFDSWPLEKRLAWSDANKAKPAGEGYASAAVAASSIEHETENQSPMTPADVMARYSGDEIWDARGCVRDNQAGRAWVAAQALDPANL